MLLDELDPETLPRHLCPKCGCTETDEHMWGAWVNMVWCVCSYCHHVWEYDRPISHLDREWREPLFDSESVGQFLKETQ